MTDWHDLTGFQRDLLKAAIRLQRQQATVSGQDLLAALEASGIETVNHGRLYPNFDTLVDHGLIEKGSIDQRTNDYRPTPAARELVRQELQSWMGAIDAGQPIADGGRR